MALFADTEPDQPDRRRRGRRVGFIILAVAIVAIVGVALVPAPYVIEQPGPVFNTLGSTDYNGKTEPVITVAGTTTYPTTGTLDMLTVTIAGNREQPPSWAEVVSAWLDPSKAVVPIDLIYPQNETVEQSNKASQIDMVDSQQSAIAAALYQRKVDFTTTITVASIVKGYPAAGVLKVGDEIQSVNGKTFVDADQLRQAVADNGITHAATVVVKRDGETKSLKITPKNTPGADPVPITGITVAVKYDFPISVTIKLQDVGGPSAGMMFALGIIDKTTTGKLNGGKNIAGTGTIDAHGEVGAIGGIRQKLYGAVRAGAKYFLAPSTNCDEVAGHVPSGLTVYSVATLNDSVTALNAIASGTGLSKLATCKAS